MLTALGNHLWQSTLFAVVAGLLTQTLRNNGARIRHCLWLVASFKFLIPFSVLILLGNQLSTHNATFDVVSNNTPPSPWSVAMERFAQPLLPQAQAVVGSPLATPPPPTHPLFDLTSVTIAVWTCGIAVVLGIVLFRWRRITATLRSSEPYTGQLQPDSPVPVNSSTIMLEPAVIGIFKPVLLLPRGITERLAPEQLRAIVAHELCHVRRRDNLTGAIHLLVQAAFWFHPLVWWIGLRIIEERERACDEAVLESGSDPTVYAEGLLNVCEFYLASRLVCAAGVSGAELKKRIAAIMQNRVAGKVPVAKKALLTMVALLTVATPIIAGITGQPGARSPVTSAGDSTTSTASTTPAAVSTATPPASVSIRFGSPDSREVALLIGPTGKFTLRNRPLKTLIGFAYDLEEPQIIGPTEALTTFYSMDAQTAVTPSREHPAEDFGSMVRSVLADRFHMTSHWETRRVPTYALLGGNSSAIKQAAAGDPGPHLKGGMNSVTASAVPFALFVKFLSQSLDRPILDQTGLAGTYNFKLKWGPEEGEPGAPASASGPAAGPTAAVLIETLQKQLNIQVVPQEGDVRYLVIDHIAQPSDLQALPKPITIDRNVFDRYVGHYAFPGNTVMTVSRDGERFLTQLTAQPPVEIYPTSEREFFAKIVDATITFATNQEGVATELVLHENGQDLSAPRITEAEAKARDEDLARRVREQKATPGSEAMLRRHIEALQHDQPDYDDMGPATAAAIRPQWAGARAIFADAGQLQSIKFTGVGPAGADIYQARFEKAAYEWRIRLDSAGKIVMLYFMRIPVS